MAVRLRGTFYSPEHIAVSAKFYTVDIYDNDYVGSPVTVDISSAVVSYDSDKDEDRHTPIIGAKASIGLTIYADNTDLTDFVEDFAYGEDGRFLIKIYKGTSPAVIFAGVCKAEQSGEQDLHTSKFTITATCGLGLLKDKPYHNGSALYTGIDHLSDHLIIALAKIPHFGTFWSGTDPFLTTAVDWWSDSMASGADDDAMYQAGVDHAVFYNYKNEGGIDDDVLSCYDVILHICKTFGCRIYQTEGVWRVDQIPYRTAVPYYTRTYDTTGAFLSSATNSGTNLLDQTNRGAKVTVINYDFLPIFKKAEVTYDVKMRRNFLNGKNVQPPSFPSITFDELISANDGEAIMRLTGNVLYNVLNLAYTTGVGNTHFFVPVAMLKCGAYYLKRNYTITNFTANLQAAEWTTDSSSRVYFPIVLGQMVDVGFSMYGSYPFEILTPPLPEDCDENLLSFSVGAVVKWDGTGTNPAQFTITWSSSNLFLEIYDEGTPIVQEDQVLYTATNPLDSSEVYKTTVRIGSQTLPNSAGRLFRWNGSAWLTAPLWGQGVDARTSAIGDILALNILNGQSGPRRRMNGTLYGDFRIARVVEDSLGRYWFFQRLEWDLGKDVLSGSWIEMNYGTDGVSATPVKKKFTTGGGVKGDITTVYPDFYTPTGPNGMVSSPSGFSVNPGPAVLAPISYNALDGDIAEGDTVTSIPIKTASAGSEFLAGDSVGLVNPFTGQFQYFEIATAPTAGATSLSVTSEVSSYDFPEDSFLVISQKPYAFSLPDATQGQILRFNGTSGVWEAYSGATDGHVLTWDTTNGWQAEAAGGGGITALTGDVTATGPGSVAATIANDAVTFAKFQNITTDKLLGRDTAGTGDVEQIGLGASLSFDGAGNIQRAALTGDVTAAVNGNATTIANNAVTTAKIADDAVTYAKIQNVVNDERVLGRVSGANGIIEELTQAQVQTFLGMTGTINRFALWTAANTLDSNAAYTFDAANGRMTVTGTAAGSAPGIFNINTGALSGATEFLRMVGNISGNMLATMYNSNNANADRHTIFQIAVGGASSGDPALQFSVVGQISHTIGIDNSNSDRFKITPNSGTPGGNANMGICVYDNSGEGAVGINKDWPTFPLDGVGEARFNLFMGYGNEWASANFSFGNGAGTGGSLGLNSITGTGNAVRVSFTTGNAPTADGDVFTLSYPYVFITTSIVVIGARDADAAQANLYVSAEDAAGCTVKIKGTMSANTNYVVNAAINGY